MFCHRLGPTPDTSRALAAMVVPQVGRLVDTGDPWSPYCVLDADGVTVTAVVAWFAELQAADGRRRPCVPTAWTC